VLERLENHGCSGLTVSIEEDGLAVRFICPPRLQLIQNPDGSFQFVREEP
jgi:hypothetical protein